MSSYTSSVPMCACTLHKMDIYLLLSMLPATMLVCTFVGAFFLGYLWAYSRHAMPSQTQARYARNLERTNRTLARNITKLQAQLEELQEATSDEEDDEEYSPKRTLYVSKLGKKLHEIRSCQFIVNSECTEFTVDEDLAQVLSRAGCLCACTEI